ncbi:MAG: low temperature requirement [Solirubrobacterales bacterium]|nr:low temperature requirement [Solirubrobacterales bacterium]
MSRFAREEREDVEQRATALELFYDLVFVFAITQISHHLVAGLTFSAAGESLLLLLVVWWSWNYTTWVTNELDPESPVVRGLMIFLMLASMMMAVALPGAFGPRAGLFVASYLTIQLGRHAFLTFAAAERGTHERERAGRILAWFALAGVFWVAGAFAHDGARVALWLVALAVDYGAPLTGFWIPGRSAMGNEAWEVETAHFSERFGLFIIIALGESIVLTGGTTSELTLSATRVAAFAVAFLGTAALWWMYFARIAELAHHELRVADDRTSLARDAYTYLHALLVVGVIVAAVGDELVIAHPGVALAGREVAAVVAGPAIYLAAHALFRRRLTGTLNLRRLAGAGACAALGLLAAHAPALVLGVGVLVILWAVILADYVMSGRHADLKSGETPPGWSAAT